MSDTVTQADADVNVADADEAKDQDAGTPTPESETPPVDPKDEKNEAEIERISDEHAKVVDPKNMLKNYAKIGKMTLDHAIWQMHQHKDLWEAKDFTRLCDRITDKVKLKVAIKDVRPDVYVRVYLWVEAVKPLVPDVDKLSYYQVANKFLPTLAFSTKTLSGPKTPTGVGALKPEWAEWVRTTVARQLSAEPMTIKQLDLAIEEQKRVIEDAANAKLDPEKKIEAERRKAVAERTRKEMKVRENLTTALDEALSGTLTPTEAMGIIEKIAKDRKVALPNVGPNAASSILETAKTMTADEARAFAKALFAAGNFDAIESLRKTLDLMARALDASRAVTQAA